MNEHEITAAVNQRIEAKKQAAVRRKAERARVRAVLAQRRAGGLRQRHNLKISRRGR